MSEQWPPPADDATFWETLRAPATWPESEEVQVRTVRLWGRDVLISEDGAVWCPSCRRFRPVQELARPDNGCPVGLRWPSGVLFDADDEPVRVRVPRVW